MSTAEIKGLLSNARDELTLLESSSVSSDAANYELGLAIDSQIQVIKHLEKALLHEEAE